jgi:DNA-binding IclR family transcriptional regulator
MDVLRAVATSTRPCTPASIAAATGIPRPTVYRLLETLETLGVLERVDGDWAIGYELIQLARGADLARILVPRTRHVLDQLVERTGETAMLAVPRERLYIDVISQVDAPNLLGVMPWVGRPVPIHASAAGKIALADLTPPDRASFMSSATFRRLTPQTIIESDRFMAELDTVAAQGYAETIDELEQGLSGICAPARDATGTLAAVVGVYGPTSRITGSERVETTGAVLEAGERISALLRRAKTPAPAASARRRPPST